MSGVFLDPRVSYVVMEEPDHDSALSAWFYPEPGFNFMFFSTIFLFTDPLPKIRCPGWRITYDLVEVYQAAGAMVGTYQHNPDGKFLICCTARMR